MIGVVADDGMICEHIELDEPGWLIDPRRTTPIAGLRRDAELCRLGVGRWSPGLPRRGLLDLKPGSIRMFKIPPTPISGSMSPARLNSSQRLSDHDLCDKSTLAVVDQRFAERDRRRGADDLVNGRRPILGYWFPGENEHSGSVMLGR